MITRFAAAVSRHRRVILSASVVLSLAYLTIHAWVPSLSDRAFPVLMTAFVVAIALALVVTARPRVGEFDVRPEVPAFVAPPHPGAVFNAVATVILGTVYIGTVVRDLGSDESLVYRLLGPAWVLAAALAIIGAWRTTGIELRPDGLRDREWAGVLVVPWEALPVVPSPWPGQRQGLLPVKYGRSELVRRRGLVTSRKRLVPRHAALNG